MLEDNLRYITLSTGVMDCKTEKSNFDYNDPEDDKRLLTWTTPHHLELKTIKVEETSDIKPDNGDEDKGEKNILHTIQTNELVNRHYYDCFN